MNFIVHYVHDKNLKKYASQYLYGRLIDIGCGEKPYQKILAEYVSSHIGVDHDSCIHDKSKIDLMGTAYSIPADNNSFDSALCTAVLEHLEEPELALVECYRVLKPGGIALYSVPFIWHLHEAPRDYYRFTKYGLDYLFKKSGFDVIEIKALSGFWLTFGQLLVYNIYRYNRGPLKYIPVIPILGLIIQVVSYFLDNLDRNEDYTWIYMVVVRKPIP